MVCVAVLSTVASPLIDFAHAPTLKGPCDEECQGVFAYGNVSSAILGALSRRIDQLKEQGATELAVDLTGNGGGTDWSEGAARLFTTREVGGARILGIRHPHWELRSKELIGELEAALQAPALTAADRALLTEALARQRAFHAEVSTPCDRTGLDEHPPRS